MARYDYDRGYNPGHDLDYARFGGPAPYGWYPGAFWGGVPMYGWGAWGGEWGYPPYFPPPEPRSFRRPPRESPTYGRGGDRALQQWARRAGYDAGYEIRPRPRRYDRGW